MKVRELIIKMQLLDPESEVIIDSEINIPKPLKSIWQGGPIVLPPGNIKDSKYKVYLSSNEYEEEN